MLHSDKQGTPPCSDILFSSSPPSPVPAAPPVTATGTVTAPTTTASLRSIMTTTATVRPTAASTATRAPGAAGGCASATATAATGMAATTAIPTATTAAAIPITRRTGGIARTGPTGPRNRRDRKSVASGKSVADRVDLGGRRIIKKKQTTLTNKNL